MFKFLLMFNLVVFLLIGSLPFNVVLAILDLLPLHKTLKPAYQYLKIAMILVGFSFNLKIKLGRTKNREEILTSIEPLYQHS